MKVRRPRIPDIRSLTVGAMATNCYLVSDPDGKTVVIDPGDDSEYICETLSKYSLTPKIILASHGHFDHIMGAYALCAVYSIPFAMSRDDEFLLSSMQSSAHHFLGLRVSDPPPVITIDLSQEKQIRIGEIVLSVITTPGHTPGSISLYLTSTKMLFTGDTLFANGCVGRTDFRYSDPHQLAHSIRTILAYPPSTYIYSGHDKSTTVAHERTFHANTAPSVQSSV